MINKFKIGDKVRGIEDDIKGCEGIIVQIREETRITIKLTKLGSESWHNGKKGGWIIGENAREGRWTFELIVSNDEDMKGGNECRMTIKIGDKVRRICGKQKGMEVGDYSVVNSVGETCVTLTGFRGNHLIDCLEVVGSSCCKEKMDIETLKTFNKKNLAEGRKQAEEDKANYEATESKNAYKGLVDREETQERIIKVAKEELKKIGDDLKLFSK